MQIETLDMPSRRLYCVRHVGPYPQIGQAFGRLEQLLEQLGAKPMAMLAVFHDDPHVTPADELRSDAACELSEPPSSEEARLTEMTLPPGHFARWVHRGPYAGLPQAWKSGFDAIRALCMQPVGICYEEYLNDPCNTAPEALETLIYQQVQTHSAK
jgi:AraC family transcriptional regulator